VTSSLRDLKVYTTYPHSCSYLSDQEATTLFVDPRQEVDKTLYSKLSAMGFRRSGGHIYRPHCGSCNACIPARIPVETFNPSRRQRRTNSRNRDLVVEHSTDISDKAAYELYCRYIEDRHADGDMYPPEREQYDSFLSDEWGCTNYYRFYNEGELIAVAVIDELEDGLSAIYTFFEPAMSQRSLGGFAVLWQIEKAREMGLAYVYLGYWVRGCQKMAYKSEYRPLELYLNNRWTSLL
jgi:arginyl-tRNA--protein-N-Asp/Glu arginylyltransferase